MMARDSRFFLRQRRLPPCLLLRFAVAAAAAAAADFRLRFSATIDFLSQFTLSFSSALAAASFRRDFRRRAISCSSPRKTYFCFHFAITYAHRASFHYQAFSFLRAPFSSPSADYAFSRF
jgi:hypothetical protein